MAKDLQENLEAVLGTVAREASKNLMSSLSGARNSGNGRSLPGSAKGLIAGAGVAAVAPVAVKGARKLMQGLDGVGSIAQAPGKLASQVGSSVGNQLGDKLGQKIDESGGPRGILKDTAKDVLPFGGGGGGGKDKGKGGLPGVGKGRRMPVQQSVDIGLPIETVYNQWTQFEEWPNFMHRVTRVTQEDDCTVSFETKIWGRTREFNAKIETQIPDERIKWSVTEGLTHTGVVTFHELGPKLTRILLGFDVQPGGMIEKFARGARYIKRAARADLHRFKAFIETQESETGAWRGRIENGELVEEHDPSYDQGREYSQLEGGESDQEEKEDRKRARSNAQGRSGSRAARGASGRSKQSSSRSRSASSGRSGSSSRSGSSERSRSSRSGTSGRSGSTARASASRGSSASGRSRSSSSGQSGGSGGRGNSSSRSGRSGTRTRSASARSRGNGRG